MSLAHEILVLWAPALGAVDLKTGSHGCFEVSIDGEKVFSKERLDRFPKKGEVSTLLEPRLGSPPEWRSTHQ